MFQSKNKMMAFVMAAAMALTLMTSVSAEAKLSVVATSPDLGAMVREIGGADVEVDVLAKGTQDLHHLETKPSYMARLSRADLVVQNGLALEIGWLPSVIRGARNPKLNSGEKGNLDLGSFIEPIEVPTGGVTRAEGDVHPEGNPHWTLDPVRVAKAALALGDRLAELDPAHAAQYKERAKSLSDRLTAKTKDWAARIKATGFEQIVTYHKTLAYFAERFGLKIAGYLEPKPGIPPTAQHTIELVKTVREKNVRLILVEHFYDERSADRIASANPQSKVRTIPAAVDATANIKTNEDLFEAMVKTIEDAKK